MEGGHLDRLPPKWRPNDRLTILSKISNNTDRSKPDEEHNKRAENNKNLNNNNLYKQGEGRNKQAGLRNEPGNDGDD